MSKILVAEEEPLVLNNERDTLRMAVWKRQGVLVDYPAPALSVAARLELTCDLVGLAETCVKDKRGSFNFIVHPDNQGQGIGTRLLRETLVIARRNGVEELIATTIQRSISERILRNIGFEQFDPSSMINDFTRYAPRTWLRLKL